MYSNEHICTLVYIDAANPSCFVLKLCLKNNLYMHVSLILNLTCVHLRSYQNQERIKNMNSCTNAAFIFCLTELRLETETFFKFYLFNFCCGGDVFFCLKLT